MELRIREILNSRKESISSFAGRVGITQANMSNIINGKSSPTLETLNKIAEAFNIPITELFLNSSNDELTALIQHKGEFYKANTLAELEKIVEKIRVREQ